jgi:streptogramin lyase
MSSVAAALALCAAAGADRADAIAVTEFPLPVASSGPLGIAAGPDGNVWFTETAGSRVGRVTPAGNVTDFSNGAGVSTGGSKWDIAAGPDGSLWYTDQDNDVVGRMTPPATAVEFPVPASPTSVGPRGIAAGPDGNLWVAADGGAIIRVTPAGVPTEFTAGLTSGSRPLDIAAGPDGALWFTEQAGRIGRITPAGAIAEFSSGISPGALPSGIAAGPDGNLWFTELVGNRIGRITPAGVVTEFAVSPLAQPRSIIAGPDGDLWFTEENLRRLGRITTGGVVTEYPLTLANAGRPAEIARGPNRTLWITTAAGNHVARVLLHPTVATGAAGAITQTTARIAGTVDPFASSTGYVVQYGRTTAYGAVTEAEIVLPAPGPVPVAVPLAGLAPGTRYHYRLVGSSFAGTTEGADATFTTAGTPGSGRGTGPSSRDRTGPRMRIGGAALLARRGRVSLSLGCPLAETLGCRGRVRLVRMPPRGAVGIARAPLRLGSAPFRIGGGQTKAVVVRLTPRARALLRARGALRVRAVARAVDAAGNDRETGRRLALRLPRG